jgi:uncharacterized membrane protein YuzA (DUF378 family)
MWQTVLTYIIVGLAVIYSVYSLVRTLFYKKDNTGCTGCDQGCKLDLQEGKGKG